LSLVSTIAQDLR